MCKPKTIRGTFKDKEKPNKPGFDLKDAMENLIKPNKFER